MKDLLSSIGLTLFALSILTLGTLAPAVADAVVESKAQPPQPEVTPAVYVVPGESLEYRGTAAQPTPENPFAGAEVLTF